MILYQKNGSKQKIIILRIIPEGGFFMEVMQDNVHDEHRSGAHCDKTKKKKINSLIFLLGVMVVTD